MRLLLALILWLFAAPAWAGFNEPVGCAQTPALTGDTTTSAGSCATSSTWHKVGLQNVSAGASIAFTGLATYNNYLLVCTGIFPATNATDVNIQIGEGATPTWQTTNYRYFRVSGNSSATTVSGSNSASAVGVNIAISATNTIAAANDITIHLWDTLSSTKVKHIHFSGGNFDTNLNYREGSGSYTGGTNVVTAVRIITPAGNISGVCTLYGMVQ